MKDIVRVYDNVPTIAVRLSLSKEFIDVYGKEIELAKTKEKKPIIVPLFAKNPIDFSASEDALTAGLQSLLDMLDSSSDKKTTVYDIISKVKSELSSILYLTFAKISNVSDTQNGESYIGMKFKITNIQDDFRYQSCNEWAFVQADAYFVNNIMDEHILAIRDIIEDTFSVNLKAANANFDLPDGAPAIVADIIYRDFKPKMEEDEAIS